MSIPEGQRVEAPPGLRRQLSQAVAWNVVFTPLKFVIDTASNIVKINLLSKAEVGTLSLLSSTASSVGIWVDLGIDQTLPKFIPEIDHAQGPGAVRRFLRIVIAFKLFILTLVLVTLPWLGGLLLADIEAGAQALGQRVGLAEIAPLLQQLTRYSWVFLGVLAALVLLGSLYDTLRAYLVSFFRQKAWNVITALATLMLPVLSALAVIAGLGVIGVLMAMVATACISVLITWYHVRRAMRQREQETGSMPVSSLVWRRFLIYTTIAFVISASEYFSSQYFTVYWFDGLQEVAFFWVAYSLVKQIQAYVYTPMVGIQVPLFTRVRADGGQRLGRVFGTLTRLLLLLTVPAAVLTTLFLHNLVLVQFPEYGSSIAIALILIPFLFLEPFWGLGHNMLMVHERYHEVLLSRFASLSSIPLLALLVPQWGARGAAVAIGTGKALAGLVVLGAAMRRYQLHFPWRFAGKVVSASLMTALPLVPILLWKGMIPADATFDVRLSYALITIGLGLLALLLLVGSMRLLRLVEEEDRALLAELRHPLARRLQKLL